MQIIIGNSYSKIEDLKDYDLLEKIIERLTYFNEEANFEKISLLKAVKWCKNPVTKRKMEFKIKCLDKEIWKCLLNDDLSFPTGLLPLVEEVIQKNRHIYTKIDKRIKPESNQIFRWNNQPPELRYYQKEMVDLGIEKHRGVFVSAVGSGKTYIMLKLIKELAVDSLIVVPSKGLREQIAEDLYKYFGTLKYEVITTDKVKQKDKFKPIKIVTVQTLGSLKKQGLLNKVLKDVNAIFYDELHHSGANTYLDLIPSVDHIYYRFGFTGTFLRNDSRTLELWSVLSNVLYTYYPKQAIADGFLTPTKFLIHALPGRKGIKYPREYKKNYCGNPVLLSKVLDLVRENEGKTILILVNRKDTSGKIIHQLLNEEGIENTYVSGDDKQKDIDKVREDYNSNKIKVLIASQIFGEGINVVPVQVLINCQGNKSEIATVQAIGRGVRLFKGKDCLVVHDFQFEGTKYLAKHAHIRMDIYRRNFSEDITILE